MQDLEFLRFQETLKEGLNAHHTLKMSSDARPFLQDKKGVISRWVSVLFHRSETDECIVYWSFRNCAGNWGEFQFLTNQ